jgi:coenzyme F420-reducing hydrogenase alpha subunit
MRSPSLNFGGRSSFHSLWSASRNVHSSLSNRREVVFIRLNLLFATQNNAARITISVEKTAQGHVRSGGILDGVLNIVELALRAYGP